MSTQPIKVPAIGESITEVVIGAWNKAEGEEVAADEPLVEVESDKASMEVPSPVAGVLVKIVQAEGETVGVGEVIAEIEVGATASKTAKPAAPAADQAAASAAAGNASSAGTAEPKSVPASATNGASGASGASAVSTVGLKASPAVRRMIAAGGLDPRTLVGSGPAGRIETRDLAAPAPTSGPGSAPAAGLPAAAAMPARRQGVGGPRDRTAQERPVRMTPLRKTVARRLLEAQKNHAILTTFNEIDMLNVMSLRSRYKDVFVKRHGIKLGFMSFFVKAAVEALRAFPLVNAEVRGDQIVYKDYFDIGVAVGGGKGLVVPVVRDSDRLSLAEIEKAIADLATRARENKLQLEELQGGSFTISNGGVYGSMMSTPILNPPQSGILGLHNIQKRAVVVNDEIVIRPMMYIALSYDHRIVDGREAVQFLVRVKECIEDPERLLIEV